jgi:branched-chain amino acid transport system substrate-binding protein
MNSKARILVTAGVAAVVISAMTACSASPANTADGGTVTYTIGLVAPLAGPLSDAGTRANDTLKIFAEKMNESGDVTLSDGKVVNFKVVGEDDHASPEGQIAAIRKLTGEADGLIGGLQSSPTLAGFEMAESAGLPFLITGATTNQLEAAISKNSMTYPFHVAQNASTRVSEDMGATYELLEELGEPADNVLVLTQDTDYGHDVVKYAKEWAGSAGATIESILYPAASTEFSAILQRIRAMDPQPDWIYGGLVGAEMFSFVQQKHDTGLDTFFVGATNASSSGNFLAQLPAETTEGILTNLVWVPGAGNDEYGFADAFTKATGKVPSDIEAQNFDAALLLAAAIKEADSIEPAKVAAALEKVRVNGLRGEQGFESDTHGQSNMHGVIAQIQGGKFVPVYPKAVAVGEFRR